jgi:putative DNA primase/helicase
MSMTLIALPTLKEMGRAVADRVRAAFVRYVAFHSDYFNVEADTLALWALHTHAFAAAEKTPYILITAPTPEAGKSRIVDVARHLVAAPFPCVDPSPASLYRAIDIYHPTLLVDEADTLRDSKALQAVLNSGYEIGGFVPRSLGRDGIERLGTFCPKMFAGIAGQRPPLRNATLSRCVVIPMRRRTPEETIEPFRHREVGYLDEMSIELGLWAADAVPRLRFAPEVPDALTDRQADSWEPLLAIAELLGGNWPTRARDAAVILSAAASRSRTRGRKSSPTCARSGRPSRRR